MNNSKFIFFFLLLFSIFFIISSNSWINCWIGLEINTLSFLTLVFNKNFLINSEFIVKYYLIQSISSINFLFFILLINYNFINLNIFYNFIIINLNLALLIKMGSAPFHFWMVSIIEGISWYNTFILLTLQKIPPMILISYYLNYKIMILIIVLNCFFGSLGGLNQLNIQKIMTYSSIYNFSWMFSSIMINESLFFFFILIYSLIILNLIIFFNKMKLFFINQLFMLKSQKYVLFLIFINLLSLGGLPPFLGFITKWIISMYMIQTMNLIVLVMILSSLINLYYYIQLMYPFIMIQKFESKWSIKIEKNNYLMYSFSYFSISSLILSSMLLYIY